MIDGDMQSFPLTLNKFLEHAAKWHPKTEVVTANNDGASHRIGYADLMERSRRVSVALRDLGVKQGDRVATLAWNTQAHVEAWYGVMGMGAVCHTLNPRLVGSQLAAMLNQSQARVLIVSSDLEPLARQILDGGAVLDRVLVIDGEAGAGAERLEPMIVAADARDLAWGDFEEMRASGLCFTSGTTGAPKGVSYTHRSSYLHTLRLLQADTLALTSRDSVLTVVPMFHANAWGLPFAAPAAGAKLVLPGRSTDGASLASLINAESVTVAVGIATVWLGLVEHLEAHGGATPSLRRVVVGGAPLPPALMQRIEERLGVSVQTSWGMTELSPSGTFAPPDDPGRTAAVAGRPAVGVDLLITNAEGVPLAKQRGVEGHLRVRGAAVIDRYFGETHSAINADGWFATGDLAKIDDDGNLIITGRAKDLIKSGGEWINPVEIETVVSRLPEVSLAAVIGRQHDKWGERPILLVQTRAENAITDEALLAPLRDTLAPWWIPDAVIRVAHMPLAPTGKIDKIRLRAEYGG